MSGRESRLRFARPRKSIQNGENDMGSERDRLAIRERLEWEAEQEKRQRDTDDRVQYGKYIGELRGSGITPLSFDEWRSHIPPELKDADPRLRGVAASTKVHL